MRRRNLLKRLATVLPLVGAVASDTQARDDTAETVEPATRNGAGRTTPQDDPGFRTTGVREGDFNRCNYEGADEEICEDELDGELSEAERERMREALDEE